MDASDKKRIWILGILFVMVLGGFLGLQIWGTATQEEDDEPGEVIGIVPAVDDQGRPTFKYQELSPGERRALARDDIGMKLLEFVTADKLKDGPTADNPKVLEYLIDQAIWNTEVTRVGKPHYVLPDIERMKFEPGPFRGEFISAWGQVIDVDEPIPFGGRVDSVENLYGVLFRAADGTLYHVLSTVAIDRKPDDWIQVYGLFYRLRTMTVKGKEEEVIGLVLVKDKEVFKAYPPFEVTELDPAWASEVHELRYDESRNTDERPFWLTMSYVKRLGKEGYDLLRESPDFKITDFKRDAKPILDAKEKHRFKFVAMRGSIIRPYADILQSDNPGKIGRIDTALLLQPTEYLVFLASPRPWSEYDVEVGSEYVQIEGIFYKRWTYIPEKGPPAREIPLVIVTGVYPVDRTDSPLMVFFQAATVGLVLLVIGTFFVLALRDRKKVRDFRADYRQQKRGRSEAREGEPPEGL